MNRRNFQTFVTLFFLVLLFLFPNASFEGAKKGLLLWFQIVLPTLLPFLIFSNLILQLNITHTFSAFLYPILGKIMPISPDGCYPIALGLLSGYPMGAKACADMTLSGKITAQEGQFLLSFCNNASPMFLLNYLLLQSLQIEKRLPLLMCILIGSSLLSGYLYLFLHRSAFRAKKETPTVISDNTVSLDKPAYFQILDRSIMNGFEVITKIGGYIILFSLLANLIIRFAPLHELPKALLIGSLEITTGIQYIKTSSLSFPVKFLLAMTLSAFGGISSIFQTGSVLLKSPLKLSVYVKYKLLNSLICFCFSLLYLYFG